MTADAAGCVSALDSGLEFVLLTALHAASELSAYATSERTSGI